MKKFSYRMENVLKIDIQLEEQQKIAFALANNALEEEKSKLVRLTIRRRKFEQALTKLIQEDSLNLRQIKETRDAIDYMKRAIREQMFAIANAEKQLEKERIKLNERRMERKTQEKLKEYAFEEYKQEYAREESREIDQTVTYTYSTKVEE